MPLSALVPMTEYVSGPQVIPVPRDSGWVAARPDDRRRMGREQSPKPGTKLARRIYRARRS